MPTPSEQIRALIPQIARQRLGKAKSLQAQGGRPVILSDAEERQMVSNLAQNPMTWVTGVLAYLDGEATRRAEWEKQIEEKLTATMEIVGRDI